MPNKKGFIEEFAIPLIIAVITIIAATYIQLLVFKLPNSVVSFIIRLMIGGFVSDLVTALWIRHYVSKTFADEYSYNGMVSEWIAKHLNLNSIHIVLIGIVYCIAISLVILWIGDGERLPAPSIVKKGLIPVFIAILFIAPIVETLIIQCLVIESIRWITKRVAGYDYVFFSGIVSAITFGLMHNYSNLYVLYAFLLGLYLSFSYIYITTRYNSRLKGLLCTILLHFTINLFPFMAMVIEKLS